MGLKLSYIGLKVIYMGLKLTYMGPKLTFSKEALVGDEWNTKDLETSTNNSEKSLGQLQREKWTNNSEKSTNNSEDKGITEKVFQQRKHRSALRALKKYKTYQFLRLIVPSKIVKTQNPLKQDWLMSTNVELLHYKVLVKQKCWTLLCIKHSYLYQIKGTRISMHISINMFTIMKHK